MKPIIRALLTILLVCLCVHFLFFMYVIQSRGKHWAHHLTSSLIASPTKPTTGFPITDYIIKSIRMPVNTSFRDTSQAALYTWKEEMVYPTFKINHPRFASNRSRELFYRFKGNVEFLNPPTIDRLSGTIYHVTNGTYSTPHDCGYRSTLNHVLKRRVINANYWSHCLVPLLIPDGHAFQHFIDGVLPKIVQVMHVLRKDPRCRLLLWKPRDKAIYDMLSAMNISRSQIFINRGGHGAYGADHLVYTCNTPPLHPLLWTKARTMLGAATELTVPIREAYIIVMTRSGCHNCGRKILNQDRMIEILQKRYGKEIVKVFNGPYSYNDTLTVFGQAKLILGPHGGGMYNVMFAPKGTVVVEFMPTHLTGEMAAASKMIIMAQASLLGQEYWRVALPPVGSSDMNVDLVELERLLDIVDQRDKLPTKQ